MDQEMGKAVGDAVLVKGSDIAVLLGDLSDGVLSENAKGDSPLVAKTYEPMDKSKEESRECTEDALLLCGFGECMELSGSNEENELIPSRVFMLSSDSKDVGTVNDCENLVRNTVASIPDSNSFVKND